MKLNTFKSKLVAIMSLTLLFSSTGNSYAMIRNTGVTGNNSVITSPAYRGTNSVNAVTRAINSVNYYRSYSNGYDAYSQPNIYDFSRKLDEELIRNEFFKLVNNVRVKNLGQSTELVQRGGVLKTFADIRTNDITKVFSHNRPNGVNVTKYFEETQFYPYSRNKLCGENIIRDVRGNRNEKEIAQSMFRLWMNSEGHRRNILNKRYTEHNMGIIVDRDYVYAAHIFTCDKYIFYSYSRRP